MAINQDVGDAQDIRTGRQAEEAGSFIAASTFGVILEGQSVAIRKNSGGAETLQPRINLIEGPNVTITIVDDPVNSEADITIAAASAAATTEPYVTIGNTAGLSGERALTGTANQITITDNGVNSTVVISIPANAVLAGLVLSTAGRLAVRQTTPATITANQNNYNPGTGGYFRLATDASRNITGIVAGGDGDVIYLRNVGSFDFVLTNLDGASSAANQIVTGTGGSVTYAPNDVAKLIYDSVDTKWVLVV